MTFQTVACILLVCYSRSVRNNPDQKVLDILKVIRILVTLSRIFKLKFKETKVFRSTVY
jgi:hypothetical protein